MNDQRSLRAWFVLTIIALATCDIALHAKPVEARDRPLKGSLSGVVTFEYDWADPVFPVTTVMDAVGAMSHLGNTESHWAHNPPIVLPEYMNGQVVFTAANGDELRGEYGPDSSLTDGFTVTVVDGTGRFGEATGLIEVSSVVEGEWGDDGLPIQPWYVWLDLKGTISYSRASSASRVPEPATFVMLMGTLVGTAFIKRKR